MARAKVSARAFGAALGAAALTAGLLAVPGTAAADTRPPNPRTPATVSADALPTLQVNGVVWSQVVVGTTVYAGGKFSSVRPAGAAPGTGTIRRNNIVAYDIRTGAMINTFRPGLNGQVLAVAASPDRRRLYVVGDFTMVNSSRRYRIAAFDTATGALVPGFRPVLDYRARAIVATNSRVYVGGAFSSANGNKRTRLAAFNASNGALLSWRPSADNQVMSMVLAPGGRRIVVGGQFGTINGRSAYGLAAIDATTGNLQAFPANRVVRNAGRNAGIISLATDGRLVYGTGFVYGRGGNLEGGFATDAAGNLVWVQDCHGDHYSGFPVGGVFYTVGHAHSCANVGGFPETNPRTHHQALAFTTAATGKITKEPAGTGYFNWEGKPSPSMLVWFPRLEVGTATGQNQAAWSVTGNASYVVLGGEFPKVNGQVQQGLVRFAVSSLAPNKQGPRGTAAELNLSGTSDTPGEIDLSWRTTWDRDNEQLTYTVVREGSPAATVHTEAVRTKFWLLRTRYFTDTGLEPGRTYTYRLTVTDPFRNTVRSSAVSVEAAGAG